MAARQVLRINDGTGLTISLPMLFVIVGLSLLLSPLHLLLQLSHSPLLTSFCRCRSEFDGFVRIFRLMLRLLFTVGTVSTVHSGSYAPLVCLPCNFSTLPLFARAISQVAVANKRNTFSPLSHFTFPSAIIM